MAARIISGILALTLTACANAEQVESVQIKNTLSSCIEVIKTTASACGEIPLLMLDYKLTASTAECGCKSDVSAYAVYEKSGGYESFLMAGKVIFGNQGSLKLPLSNDSNNIAHKPLLLVLTCAQPD
jgi:hypothetical protein